MLLSLLLALVRNVRLTAAISVGLAQGVQVSTTNGLIEGHPAENRSDVTEFLGIPYAQPPVGELRFAAPRPYMGKTLYVASKFVSTTFIIRDLPTDLLAGLVRSTRSSIPCRQKLTSVAPVRRARGCPSISIS